MFARFKSHNHNHSSAPPRPRSNSGFSSTAAQTKPPPVLIQRLIILHDGLMPLDCDDDEDGDVDAVDKTESPSNENASNVTKGKRRRNPQSFLSEDASLEEHGEFILYYYDHSIHSNRHLARESEAKKMKRRNSAGSHSTPRSFPDDAVDQVVQKDHCTEEAVKFAGLCRALRSLPSALHPQPSCENAGRDSGIHDETDVVYLSDSTLVFISLELDGDVFAVLQLPRASNRRQSVTQSQRKINENASFSRRSRVGYGADPDAIRHALRRSHSLFSILHGGGIHQRLLRTNHLEKSVDWFIEEKGDLLGVTATHQKRISVSYSGTDLRVSPQTNLKYCYGGMKELFELRREDRKLNRSDDGVQVSGRSSWRRKSNTLDMFEDIADQMGRIACQDQLETLLQLLPITSLREDIEVYYDQWIANMQGMCAVIEGGVGRSIVEMVPAPVRQDTARGQYPPMAPPPFLCLAAAEFMRSLFADDVCLKSTEFQLCGISFLYQNRYVSSEVLPAKNDKHQSEDISLSHEILMLLEHFGFQQKRESSLKQKETQKSTTPSSAHNPFDRWMSNISAGSVKNDNVREKISQTNNRAINGRATGYISPPRSFSPDGKQIVDSLYVHDLNCEAWLPQVHIPHLLARSTVDRNDYANIETHVTFYGREEFSFLLFFNFHATEDDRMSGFFEKTLEDVRHNVDGHQPKQDGWTTGDMLASDVLTLLATKMNGFYDEYSFREHHSISRIDVPIKCVSSDTLFIGEPGMDIIFIDREINTFLLLSQHDLSANDFQRKVDTTSQNNDVNILTRGLFGVGSKIKATCDRENETRSLFKSTSCVSLLDCRHKLAAYLPLDVMLAFDDMFNEIRRLCCRKSIQDTAQPSSRKEDDRGKAVELCTYLPQGWVYGRAHGGRELYILLDTFKFVTISDVNKAVTRTRERILYDTLL